jgi:hypothetical protein
VSGAVKPLDCDALFGKVLEANDERQCHMAQRTIVQLVSDLSGDEMQAGEGRTVEFSVDGTSYTIDLTDKEAAGFDKALAMYVEHATKTSGGSPAGRKRSSSAVRSGSGRSKDELSNIRAWAQANGHKVSERGRIKQDVLDAYHAANG